MPDQLHFTDSDEANALIAADPMALLVGFVLDQQVTVQKAFSGPLALRERLGAIDAATLACADLEPVFRERPAIHRFPANMARRVHELAVHVRDRYDGDAERAGAAGAPPPGGGPPTGGGRAGGGGPPGPRPPGGQPPPRGGVWGKKKK